MTSTDKKTAFTHTSILQHGMIIIVKENYLTYAKPTTVHKVAFLIFTLKVNAIA